MLFKKEEDNIHEPGMIDWHTGAFYMYRENFPSIRLLMLLEKKAERPGWGIELSMRLIYKFEPDLGFDGTDEKVELSYAYGQYGKIYTWTLEKISDKQLALDEELQKIVTIYLTT